METVDDRRRFEVRDGNGALVVRGAVSEGDSIMDRLRAARGVVAAQGILPTVRMLLDPEVELTSVTTDVKDGHTPLTIQSELRSRPRLSEIDRGDLEIGGDSELGSLLRSMHFEPSLAYRDPDLSFTMPDAQPSRTPPP